MISLTCPRWTASRKLRDYDKEMYKNRHLIENFFAKLKQYRAIATRYDKLGKIFSAPFTWQPVSFGSIDDTP